ncbi:MAG: outer membrane beta-barrel protein [Ferruginibacter sp.]
MKQLLLLIVIHTCFGAQAQKVLIGYNFSSDYNYRTLKNSDGSSSANVIIKTRNDQEIARFGYTTGLNVCFGISKQLALETGIQYSNKGYRTSNKDLVYFPPDPTAPVKAKFVYAYQYLGIPIKATFFFGKGNLRFVTGIGFTTNLLLNIKNTATYEYANGSTEKKTQSSTSGFNKVDLSPMVSAGFQYKLNNKIHISAEPTFRYGLIKTKDVSITEKLWNVGLNMGLYYVLK